MKNEKGTIVLAGGVIGLIAAILVFFGNPLPWQRRSTAIAPIVEA